MKKVIFLLAIGAVSATGASAQWITAGPEIGLNLSTINSRYNGNSQTDGVRPGLKVGGNIDIGVSRCFSIQPGLFYSMKGSANVDRRTFVNGSTTVVEENTQDYRINYVEMPVNLLIRLGAPRAQFFFGGGPYVALALGGKATNIQTRSISNGNGSGGFTDRSDYTLNIGDNATDDVRPIDAGLNVNAGFQSRHGMFVRANMGFGMVNVLPNGNDDNYMHNVNGTISLGFLMGH